MSVRADGRWAGRLTGRPLPDRDTALERLGPAARDELARHWLVRAASERRVGDAFVVVRDALVALGASESLVALATRAIDDEHRHAELARVVACRIADRELPLPTPSPLVVPAHRGASARLRHVLHVVGHSALNETFASAVLEAALAASTGELAKAALRELLSDEIDHARIGWALLASLDPETLAAVFAWLPELLRANLASWRTADREVPSDPSLVSHGALSPELIEAGLQSALKSLVMPGFTRLGFATSDLQPWLDAGARTVS